MATKKSQIYKCSVCGNMVEVIHQAAGTLSCCNKPMELQEENSTDAAGEKHVPVIETVDGGIKVTVGSVAHPMAEDHYIEWIQVLAGNTSYRAYLEPGQAPEATFPVPPDGVTAREYCNLHGVWKTS